MDLWYVLLLATFAGISLLLVRMLRRLGGET